MTFVESAQPVKSLLLAWIVLAHLLLITAVWQRVRQKRSILAWMIPFIFYFVFRYIWWSLRSAMDNHIVDLKRKSWLAEQVPLSLLFLAAAAYTAYAMILLIRTRRWQKTHLSAMSVKEAVDTLPTGICFTADSGRVILINRRMNEICRQLTGEEPGDGQAFWQLLAEGQLPPGVERIRNGQEPILRLADEQVIGFQRFWHTKNRLWEIIAADITVEMRKAQELQERGEELREQVNRLREYSHEVTRVTREREESEARAAIHDRLNRILLTTLHSLEEGAGEEEQVLTLWKGDMLLREEEGKKKMDPKKELEESAESIGLRLVFEGEWPQQDAKKLFLLTTAGECMINAVRHGKAGTIRICSGEDCLTFENDGTMPEGEVHFGSGLKSIRERAARLGGTVRISEEAPFCLTVDFQKRRGEQP